MPVAVNVPVVLDEVDELDPLSPQETKLAPIQAYKAINKVFFIYKSHFIWIDGTYQMDKYML